ncbi:Glucose-1-phosphate adenylyltransferase [uncultured Sporomusa sp.]|uniref:Glucose-1-phosphate adenylyltransferase n=1 Tax=uncultured Sporomusa sp. TaxID=307249 RepID=A0A212LNW2_9FIRM|nr:sugar phosphate nucleotidyltransferase [uncultured Sporomusa sp.]SCM79119.1 Glucose-1-phosphate adenylyltransferase [uncultured Sporomusa sp.]
MKRAQIIALVLAGGAGTRLAQLTKSIAKPAVPFAGSYRLIDFTLSNCCNSQLDTIGVLMPRNPFSLPDTIGQSTLQAQIYPLHPVSWEQGGYSGTANAVYANIPFIEQFNPDYVLITSGDHVYKMDYRNLLLFHRERNADATIAVSPVPWSQTSRFGIVSAAADGAIKEFNEKPLHADSNLASMGVYVFSWPQLKQQLEDDAVDGNSCHDFGRNIIPAMMSQAKRLFVYSFSGYWRDVGTVEALYSAQMDLLQNPELLSLQDPQWPIYSLETAPTNKSSVYSNVNRSIIFAGAHISSQATIKDAIVMTGARIGPGSFVERAIIGPYAVLETGSIVRGGEPGYPPVAVIGENLVVSANMVHSY